MTAQKLYTIVFEYSGGTYIAQIMANSPDKAIADWIKRMRDVDFVQYGIAQSELTEIANSDHPVPIEGCMGVWCVTGSAKNGLVLINIIATVSSY